MRIVAGKHRGLVLYEFDADNIRPTSDRVRENVFNKIQFLVPNSNVLDLFGGTGAVSLEFLSRGAAQVITCDNNKDSIKLINKNFAKANEVSNLLIGDFSSLLNKLGNKKFDIIFLDPPYSTDYGEQAIKIIDNNHLLAQEGIIIYEHLLDKKFDLPSGYEIYDYKKYGTIAVSFIRRK